MFLEETGIDFDTNLVKQYYLPQKEYYYRKEDVVTVLSEQLRWASVVQLASLM